MPTTHSSPTSKRDNRQNLAMSNRLQHVARILQHVASGSEIPANERAMAGIYARDLDKRKH